MKRKHTNVSIIIPLYNHDPALLQQMKKKLKEQRFQGRKEIIEIQEQGLAQALNTGIQKAKYDTIVSLHQDCIPASNDWLSTLIAPLQQKEVVASTSKVELPAKLWNSLDPIARILSVKEQKIITPLLDEKGCAYKKSVLIRVGLFNQTSFTTAGEDFDMYLKLKHQGDIVYPNAKVLHHHRYTAFTRLKKELQLSNGFGTLVRIYGTRMPRWYLGMLKALPCIGTPLFLPAIQVKRLGLLSLLAVPLYLLVNLFYSYGFWKGFLMKKQTL